MITKNYASDFFRCFFTFIVVFHHLSVNWLYHGYLAVDFFFLLSGYFLMQTYENNRKHLDARGYTKRRLKKLYPHYLISFIILFLLYYTVAGNKLTIDSFFYIIPELLLIQNIGIFDGGLNSPTWYLSVLIVGGYFLYYSLSKFKYNFCFFIAPIIILFSYTFLSSTTESIENWGRFYGIYIPLLRGIADMCIGIIIYCAIKKNQEISKNKINISKIIELFSLFGMIYILLNEGKYDIYGVMFLTIIVYNCFNKKAIIYNMLNHKVFNNISKYMYPIYLNHLVFVMIYNKLKNIIYSPYLIILVVCSLFIYSIFTFKFVNTVINKYFYDRL